MNLPLLTVIVIIYLGILTTLAYQGYRYTKTADDYMVAGRNIHPAVMALSYGAAFISTSAIVGFGGAAGQFGFSLLWLTFLTIFLGIFVAFAFFGVRIRKMSLNLKTATFPSLLGERYQSRFITVFSGLMIFIFMPAYTSIILIGGARFLEEALVIDYNMAIFILALIVAAYVLSGGLRAVMYTDAFCASVMFLGMVFLLITTYSNLGGIVAAHQGLTDLKHLVPPHLVEIGHQGWTSMPALGSPIWWTVVSTIVMGVGIGALAQPQLATRFMTVKETRSLYRAVLIGGIFIFFMTGTAFVVGPLSNLYFYNLEGVIAIEAAQGNVDSIIPVFISSIMPTWFLYLFMLTLLSAALSTLSSLIHVQGMALGRDILEAMEIDLGGDKPTSSVLARVGVLVGVVLAVTLAYIMPISIIARATAFWFGICASGFLPALIGALYWRRGTRLGAAVSIVSGYAVSIFGYVFLHIAESQPFGIARALFGKDALLSFPWTHIDPLIYALPVSAAVYIIVSLLSQPPREEHLETVFENM